MEAATRECLHCKASFTTQVSFKKYCNRICQSAANKIMCRSGNTFLKLSTSTVGALTELIVCADLMKMGYEVFRAMSPSSYCDIVAIKDDKVYRYEVRTGHYFKSKHGGASLGYTKQRTAGKSVVVVTHSDNKIHYI